MTRRLWLLLGIAAAALPTSLAYPAWQHFHPVAAGAGWRYRVLFDDLPEISGLALDARGALLASLELKHGEGSILRIDAEGARSTEAIALSKPDGMIAFRDGIAYSQEEGEQAVRWLHDGRDAPLFRAVNAEGLATDGHDLYAVEDRPTGARLLRFDPDSGTTAVLRDGLEVAEGVAACPDGRIFVAEKKKARIRLIRADGTDTVVAEGARAPGALACDEAGLWIAEDRTHGARLLLLDDTGTLHVILTHLRSAQTLLPIGNGRYLLAEQGRSRILEITRGPA